MHVAYQRRSDGKVLHPQATCNLALFTTCIVCLLTQDVLIFGSPLQDLRSVAQLNAFDAHPRRL
jgi:hypothetical protein